MGSAFSTKRLNFNANTVFAFCLSSLSFTLARTVCARRHDRRKVAENHLPCTNIRWIISFLVCIMFRDAFAGLRWNQEQTHLVEAVFGSRQRRGSCVVSSCIPELKQHISLLLPRSEWMLHQRPIIKTFQRPAHGELRPEICLHRCPTILLSINWFHSETISIRVKNYRRCAECVKSDFTIARDCFPIQFHLNRSFHFQ